jgi:tetratricopeptide (TPR) repeat protein
MKKALVIFVMLALPLRGDYEQAFRTGVTAYNRGQWEQCISAMRQAIRERPNENASTVFIYGTWYEPYIPHYYLGMALYKSGQCGKATEALTESLRHKILPKKQNASAEQALAECAQAEPQPPASSTVTQTTPVTTTTAERLPIQPTTTTIAPPISPPPATTTTPPHHPEETSTRMPITTPPRQLVNAVAAYLHGDYQESLRLLDGVEFADEKNRAQAMLFRGAAAHGLFLLSQGRDRDLRDRALREVRQYKRAEPKRTPDARVFSPLFLEFVRQAGS